MGFAYGGMSVRWSQDGEKGGGRRPGGGGCYDKPPRIQLDLGVYSARRQTRRSTARRLPKLQARSGGDLVKGGGGGVYFQLRRSQNIHEEISINHQGCTWNTSTVSELAMCIQPNSVCALRSSFCSKR